MSQLRWIAPAVLMIWGAVNVHAQGWRKDGNAVQLVNKKISGEVIDYTANHAKDKRFWSRVLWQRRDMYVYLPPGYNRCQKYPLMIWLHGFRKDERSFLRTVVPALDKAICAGKMPPIIAVAPDGTVKGEPSKLGPDTFFLNSPYGNFADFVLHDVWDFVTRNYSISDHRKAHILAGESMGGFAAYNLGIKHRRCFGTVIGVLPALNMRWAGRKGSLEAKFHPRKWGWKTDFTSGRGGWFRAKLSKTVHMHRWLEGLYSYGWGSIRNVSRENPIEMIDAYRVRPCDLDMYVAYTSNDCYNLDAQAESFIYLAMWRCIKVHVDHEKDGLHTDFTIKRFLPKTFAWLGARLAPFALCRAGCEKTACACTYGLPCDSNNCGSACRSSCTDPACGYPLTLPEMPMSYKSSKK